jgi:hypothetical protein
MEPRTEQVQGTVEMVKPDAGTANWTEMELLPMEVVAERFLDMEHEGQTAEVVVSFGKPFFIQGKAWCCPFRISAMGREHVTPAGGADSVHAIQMAFFMVNQQLGGMARVHKMSFLGTDDFGFARVGGINLEQARAGHATDPTPTADAAKCPVVGTGERT